MLEILANGVVLLLALYLLVGVAFAMFFVLRGVNSIDDSAAEGTWGFRLAILPGAVALWPLMVRRYRSGPPPPEERNAHRDLARDERDAGGAS